MFPLLAGYLPGPSRRTLGHLSAFVIALVALSACSDDVPSGPDVSPDVAMDIAVQPDIDVSPPEDVDVPEDITADVDVAPDVVEPPPGPGEVGAPCELPVDCNDGWCLETSQGGLCSRSCTETCQRGWRCRQNVAILPDFVLVCMPPAPTLCRPCDTNADCRSEWDVSAHACIPTGNDGSFCGGVCETDSDCPAEAFCADVSDVEDNPTRQCRPKSGVCDCGPGDIADSASTSCFNSNVFGRCGGRRTCEEDGLGDCDADAPLAEVCNDGIDDDCDGATDEEDAENCTDYWLDGDNDAFGVGTSRCFCAITGEYRAPGPFDCNDGLTEVNPLATEVCGDTLDNDCNGETDEPGAEGCTMYLVDADNDTFGLVGSERCLCAPEAPWLATLGGDCDDGDAGSGINPTAFETCNGRDDDCDGFVDPVGTPGCTPFFLDADGDGFGVGESLCLCGPQGAYSAEVDGDCDDFDAFRAPDVREVCNAKDDDCDSDTDEADAEGCGTFWDDVDRDTYGRPGSEVCLCAAEGTFDAVRIGDCDDSRDDVNIAASEICDSVDNDCDTIVDESDCGLPTVNWPTAMLDGRRTGQPFGFEGPIEADTALRWKRQLIPGVAFENSPIVAPDGRIIVAFGGKVFALNPQDGTTAWQYTLPAVGFARASPTARFGGTIVVPAGNGLVLLDKDGNLLWHMDFGGEPGDLVTGSPIVDQNGIIYVISNTHARAVTAAGGLLWQTPIDGDPTKSSDPALGPDGRLYFSGAQHVYSMSRTGIINWTWCPLASGSCDPTQRPLVSVSINEVGRVLAPMGHVLYQLADGLDQAFVISTTPVLNGSTPARIGSAPSIFSTGYTCCNPAEFPFVTAAGANGGRWFNTALSAVSFTLAVNKRDGAHGGGIFDRDGDVYIGSNAALAGANATFTGRYSRLYGTANLRGTAAWTATLDGADVNGVSALGSFKQGASTIRFVTFGDSSGTIYSYGR